MINLLRCFLLAVTLVAGVSRAAETIIDFESTWSYFKGTAEASTPPNGWVSISFSDLSWPTAAAPFRYGAGSTGTVLSDMKGSYTCLFLRQKFTLTDLSLVPAMSLNVNYDAGFVAWINGVEICRSNAPASLLYNSFAPQPHVSGIAESFSVPAASLIPGTNVLCIQAFSSGANSDAFMINARLQSSGDTASQPVFSTPHGFYTDPIQLSMTSATPGATIKYTIDGTLPSAANGTTYSAALDISSTSIIRAIALDAGMIPSKVTTQTYLFINDVVNQSPLGQKPPIGNWPNPGNVNGQVIDYGMDPDIVHSATYGPTIRNDMLTIPSFSIVMKIDDMFDPATGIFTHPSMTGDAWERPCSLEQIDPGNDNSKTFQVNAGIRIRGGFSRQTANPKHAFKFFFKSKYGDSKLDVNFPVITDKPNTQEFQQMDLRCAQNYAWSLSGNASQTVFMRDMFSHDCQLAMGHPNQGGDFRHLYLNGQYWGLFNIDERSEAEYAAYYFGGDSEDYDCIKHGGPGATNHPADGDTQAYLRLWNICNSGVSSNDAYFRLQGRNPDGTYNPGIENLLDIENMIDYMIIIYYGGNHDAPITNDGTRVNNYYALRNRNGNMGFKFFVHDAEHTIKDVNINRTGPYPAGDTSDKANPQWFFQKCAANSEFLMHFADRVQKHMYNGGVCTAAGATALFNKRKAQIDRAVVGESARWGDAKVATPLTRDNWVTACNTVLNSFFPGRTAVVINQFQAKGWLPSLAAPTFSQYGGDIPPGFTLVISDPNAAGTIYYTLDGSDPRMIGGGINSAAQPAVGSIAVALDATTTVRARVFNNNSWSAMEERTFIATQDFSKLKITEIMYHPGPATMSGNTGLTGEYYSDASLATLAFTRADANINFNYGNGSPDPRLAADSFSVRWTGFVTSNVTENFTFYTLSDEGVRLYVNNQLIIDNWSAHGLTENSGIILLPANVPVALRLEYYEGTGTANISLSWASASTPKQIVPQNSLSGGGIGVQDDGEQIEFIEVKNTGDTALNVSGVQFTEGVTYTFPSGSVIPAHGFKVVVTHPTKFVTLYPGVAPHGTYYGTLSNSGERLTLSYGGATICSVKYSDSQPWPVVADGLGFSLVPVDPNLGGNADKASNWRASTNIGGSPGADDPQPGIFAPIIISEVLSNSDAPAVDFVELYNPTGNDADIGNWYLTDDRNEPKKFKIPSGTTIIGGDYLVLDETQFNATPGVDPGFSLNSLGDSAYIFSADAAGNLTGYSFGVACGAAEAGVPFGRHTISTSEIQFPALLGPTPGAPNAAPKFGPVVISEIMYQPGAGGDEFVELKNNSYSAVRLYDAANPSNTWRVNGIDFNFPVGIEIAGRGAIVLTNLDAATYRGRYNIPANIQIFTYGGTLQDDGELLELQRPDSPVYDTNGLPDIPWITVDAVRYNSSSPWPAGATGTGFSIERISTTQYGNDPINWQRSLQPGGTPGVRPPTSHASFTAAAYAAPESAGSVNIGVVLDKAAEEPLTVHYAASAGTAAASDFQAASGDLTFAAGETAKTFTITLTASNDFDEDDRTINLALSANEAGLLADPSSAALTIADDDSPPNLAATAGTAPETGGLVKIDVTLDYESRKTISVDYRTVSGSAIGGKDYTPRNGTFVFAPGETAKSFTVPIINDVDVDYDETFTVEFSNSTNLAQPLPVLTILIDSEDIAPLVSISGKILDGATPVPNIIVSDGTRLGVSDDQGQYVIEQVPNRATYIVTPFSADYTFEPQSRNVDINGRAPTNVDFAATKINVPPVVTSGPNAAPNPAIVNQPVSFACTVIDDGALIYFWDFGDSTTETTAIGTTTHTYAAIGIYTASVKITDGGGLNVTRTVTFDVRTEAAVLDNDSDGYVNAQEMALGTNPNEKNSKPGGSADFDGDGVTDDLEDDDDNDLATEAEEYAAGTDPYDAKSVSRAALTISKILGSVKPGGGKDAFAFTVSISNVAAIQALTNLEVLTSIGGARESFILDAKGKGRARTGTLAIKFIPPLKKMGSGYQFMGGTISLAAKCKNGNWAPFWLDEGVDISKTGSAKIMMSVDVRVAGKLYGGTINCTCTSKSGKSAAFKNP